MPGPPKLSSKPVVESQHRAVKPTGRALTGNAPAPANIARTVESLRPPPPEVTTRSAVYDPQYGWLRDPANIREYESSKRVVESMSRGTPPQHIDVARGVVRRLGFADLSRERSGRAVQRDPTCRDIACRLADDFDYEIPEVAEYGRTRDILGENPDPSSRAVAHLVTRLHADGRSHVTFEYRGKEYNFGPGDKEGYKIVDRIPLRRKGEVPVVKDPLALTGYARLREVENQLAKVAPRAKLAATKVVDANGAPLRVFHGTAKEFEAWDISKSDPDALFGPGFYFTDNPEVSSGYTSKGGAVRIIAMPDEPSAQSKARELSDRGFNATTHTQTTLGVAEHGVQVVDPTGGNVRPVYLDIKNPFDVTSKESWLVGRQIVEKHGGNVRDYDAFTAYGASGLGDSYDAILYSMPSGTTRGQINEYLRKSGYDGVVYQGGVVTGGERHKAYVAFSPDQIHPAILTNEARNALFRKLLGQGLSVGVALAIVAMRDSGDDAPVDDGTRPYTALDALLGRSRQSVR